MAVSALESSIAQLREEVNRTMFTLQRTLDVVSGRRRRRGRKPKRASQSSEQGS